MSAVFDRIYRDVPRHQREELAAFREAGHRREVEAEGVRWGYVALGSGRRAVVFLPGGFATGDMWMRPMSALASRFRVISVDCSLDTFDADTCIQGLLAVLESEGVDRFALVGSSYGGGLAQQALQATPERVERAVLSHCTAVGERLAAQMNRMRSTVRWMPKGAIDLQWGIAQERAGPDGLEWSAYARAYLREVGERVDKDILLRFLSESGASAQLFRFDPGALDGWDGRVLIMSSRDDPTTFPHLDELRARYPGSREHVFDRGGHATLLFRPEAYTETLAGFLREGEP